jgi:indolepyruvate ferredoxin oxidoreductase
LARQYVGLVERVWAAERELGERTELSEAVAKASHHLLAYKDEYEVARMLTDRSFAQRLAAEVPGATRMRLHLHPPLLRALGLPKKIAVGPVGGLGLRALARLRFVRGTPFDPFGRTRVRRLERALAEQFTTLAEQMAASLSPGLYDNAVEIARAPLLVRGYEDIKLASVERYRARLAELGVPASQSGGA